MPGMILIPLNARTPEAAVAEVLKQKDQGADFIKVIDVKSAAFFAVADEAKNLGLPFLGHLPPSVNVWDASKAGMRSIEHLGPKESILLGCSTDEDAMRREIAANPPQAPQIAAGPGLAVTAALRAVANPTLATDPIDFKMMQHSMETFSAAKCRQPRRDLRAEPDLAGADLDPPAHDRSRRRSALPHRPQSPLCAAGLARALWQDLAKQYPARITAGDARHADQIFLHCGCGW